MKIEFHSEGFRELLRSGAARKLLAEKAAPITQQANAVPSTTEPAATDPYYRTRDVTDNQRAKRRIETTGPRSVRHEHKTQALLRQI